MSENLTSKVQELINNDVGDVSRLRHIKYTLENGKTFYNSDRKYLDFLVLKYLDTTYQTVPKSETPNKSMIIPKDVTHKNPAKPAGIKEKNHKQNEPASVDSKQEYPDSEPSGNTTPQSAEIHEMRKKVEGLEHALECLSKPKKKMSYGIASGGVFLLVVGLIFLFGGFALAFVPPSLPDRILSLDPMSGIVMMLIGVVPTVFGVRFIARA